MFGAAREWNRVSASLEKRVVSSTVDDGRDPVAYGDRGIRSLCSINRCNMSAVCAVSHPMRRRRVSAGSEGTRVPTYKTAEMVLVYMLEGGGQQDQLRLRFHPPIVGFALDVCQWGSKPIVQHISAKTNVRSPPFDRPAPAHVRFRSSRSLPLYSPSPSHKTSSLSSSSGLDRIQNLSQQWPRNSSVSSCMSGRSLTLILLLSRIQMKSKSFT